MSEIIFEIRGDELAGGYMASAPEYGIHTAAETMEELRALIWEALDRHFAEKAETPRVIRFQVVREGDGPEKGRT
jgi:predicted RNase H-like HicB family nuclease